MLKVSLVAPSGEMLAADSGVRRWQASFLADASFCPLHGQSPGLREHVVDDSGSPFARFPVVVSARGHETLWHLVLMVAIGLNFCEGSSH